MTRIIMVWLVTWRFNMVDFFLVGMVAQLAHNHGLIALLALIPAVVLSAVMEQLAGNPNLRR